MFKERHFPLFALILFPALLCCTDLINVPIFCLLPPSSFESCCCSVLKMGTFPRHLVHLPTAVLFSKNSCLGSFIQVALCPSSNDAMYSEHDG